MMLLKLCWQHKIYWLLVCIILSCKCWIQCSLNFKKKQFGNNSFENFKTKYQNSYKILQDFIKVVVILIVGNYLSLQVRSLYSIVYRHLTNQIMNRKYLLRSWKVEEMLFNTHSLTRFTLQVVSTQLHIDI